MKLLKKLGVLSTLAVMVITIPKPGVVRAQNLTTPKAPTTLSRGGTIIPSAPGTPTLTSGPQIVASNAQTCDNGCVPNGWGTHKSRIIRLSTGDIFTVYTDHKLKFHVMHRNTDGKWSDAYSGDAGMEPINILRGPNDQINVFARPIKGPHDNITSSSLVYYKSTDTGKSFKSFTIPGNWNTQEQGYAGAGINEAGDMVVGIGPHDDVPGAIYFSYYDHTTGNWTAHTLHLPVRYAYDYFFPGKNGDLTITGTRDYMPSELTDESLLGPTGNVDLSNVSYIFDRIGYCYIPNVASNSDYQCTPKDLVVGDPTGHKISGFVNLVDQSDAYMDTQERLHILYYDQFKGGHHLILENGQVVQDIPVDVSSDTDQNNKMRLTQDEAGHFYLINIAGGSGTTGQLEVYPATADDTDGTKLGSAIKLNNKKLLGCDDHDNCLGPTFTVPRSGNAVSNVIDGIYGNKGKVIYFQITLK